MVDSAAVALRLLELIALLFPVVALLLQLQHRVMDSNDLTVIGVVVGTGLVVLLSLSFFTVSLYLVFSQALTSLLTFSIAVIAITGFLVPILVVLLLEESIDVGQTLSPCVRTTIRTTGSRMRQFCRGIYERWK